MNARTNGKSIAVRIAKSLFALALATVAMVGSVGCDEKQLMDLARDLISGSLQDGGLGGPGTQPPSLSPPGDDQSDSGFPGSGWQDDWQSDGYYDCGCF